MRKLTWLLVSAGVLVAGLAMVVLTLDFQRTTGKAAPPPTPRIRIDNLANPGPISGTQTNSLITVKVEFCNGSWLTVGQKSLPSAGNHDFQWTGSWASDAPQVRKIEVRTSGSDWLWIDQVEVLNSAGTAVWTIGVDDNVGQCVSQTWSQGTPEQCEPDQSWVGFIYTTAVNCNPSLPQAGWPGPLPISGGAAGSGP